MSSSSVSATVAVDKATSDLLLSPDWTTNMEICDSVNSLHWQAKDVVKAVKKRLQHKSPGVQLLSLTLLEALVKNCGDYLHHQVAEKNILGEMVKIVKKKADMQVRNKILGMLDSWRLAFGGPEGKYPQYFWTYEELRRSGVEFPPRSPDTSPIITPPASHPPLRPPQGGYGIPQIGYGVPQGGYGAPQVGYGAPQAGYGVPQVGYGIPQVGYGMPSGSSTRLDEAMANEVEGLSLSSLESMRDVMDLLGDMLQAVNPSDRAAVRDEVIVDLVDRCRSNQKRLMQMLTSTGDEELLGQGLDLNDSLQTLLARHDAIASGSPLPIQTSKPIDSSPKSSEAKDSSSIAGSSSPIPASVSTGKSPIDEDYEEEEDEFTQLALRHSKPAPVPSSDSQKSSSTDIGLSNALALPDPPPPVNTTKEQDMIDLLSITLSTDQTPPPPSTQPPPPVSDQNYQFGPQPLPYESYVAPWALPHQTQPGPGYFQTRPDQGFSPRVNQTTAQTPQYAYPPPPWASTAEATSGNNAYYTPRANATSSYTATSTQAGKSIQQSNSFPTRSGDPQAAATSGASSNTGLATGQKPFVPSYRLFEDLDVFGNGDGKLNKSTNSNGTQSMIGGRK